MTDYNAMRNVCMQNSEISRSVVDEFLIYYAAGRGKLYREVNKRLARYRHVTQKFPESWVDFLKTQYIAHKLFKKGGLIKRYINHSSLNHLNEPERSYLNHQQEYSWRFSFSVITGFPAEHFYEMEDVFTGDSFLLYSPGVADILLKQEVRLWFNLIAFNGACWQCYGPIGAYRSFEPEDVFFFASELNPSRVAGIESNDEVMKTVEENPVPYMMLLSGADLPRSYHKDDQIVQNVAEYLDDSFDTGDFEKQFSVEYADGVYRLSLNRWSELPHYSSVYYDEQEKLLYLYSMTDRGFGELVKQLNSCGYDLSGIPDFRVNMSMHSTAENILKQENQLNRYASLFSTEFSDDENEELDKLNKLLAMLIPDVNAGKKPDIESIAQKAGVDLDTAREILEQVLNKVHERKKS